jgi:hypothetical protein
MSNKNSATSPLLSNKSTVIKVALMALLWILVINSGMINADADRRLQIADGSCLVDPNSRSFSGS